MKPSKRAVKRETPGARVAPGLASFLQLSKLMKVRYEEVKGIQKVTCALEAEIVTASAPLMA